VSTLLAHILRASRCALLVALLVAATAAAHAQTGGTPQQGRREQPSGDTTYAPGAIRPRDTTPRPDTPYGTARLREELRLDSLELVWLLDSLADTPQARMRRNLAMGPDDWRPTRADRAAREAELRRAMDMDFVFPNSYIQLFGISTGAVFRALGLVEDVTPKIKYTLERTEAVTVKIYNLEAELVATLVNGPQRPGVYDFEWDFLDAEGARVPYGNYVAEVIVGGRLVMRKRIEAP
jgi:hypothetical protein